LKIRTVAFAVGITLFTSGCATLIGGKTQSINISSDKRTEIEVDGRKYSTPAKIMLERSSEDKVITIANCDKNLTIESSIRPLFFGNILFGGVIGSTTDATNDAMWEYDDNVTVECK